LTAKRGFPGDAEWLPATRAARVESVRLDPELARDLAERARTDGTTAFEVIREALRCFLGAA
jgi:hypothetical protein